MPAMGSNVRKLVIRKISMLMIPPGSGTLPLAVQCITDGFISDVAKEADEWVRAALQAVKDAPDSSYTDDEEIAGLILKGIEEKSKGNKCVTN